ncbi:MAG: lipoyl(octanoyl) transferase LipB [Flavobacteriales bacterium]|nr:lipoyl(octanoyl) transferase LipB [Flavobacteriales bacterium]
MQKVYFKDLSTVDYKVAWKYQEKLHKELVDKKLNARDSSTPEPIQNKHYLLFCEHPHVYTIGKSGEKKNLLLNENQLKEKEATFYEINRGGDITYHGPGQIVGYPILDLENFFTDISKYMRYLEEAIILTLKEYGIEGDRNPGFTGVWLDVDKPLKTRKIAALGVRCSRWVTLHGFAFNINPDLDYFENIIPCGISDKQVTSLKAELGKDVDVQEVKEKLKLHFSELFEMKLINF